MTEGSAPSSTSAKTNAAHSFISFYQAWLSRQELYLHQLLSVQQIYHESTTHNLKELISRILSHYEQYYQEKSRIAHYDIFLVFSPPWFSPFERSFLWIAGFKPALAFRAVDSSISDLSEDQNQRITGLKQETRMNERFLSDEMARIQECVASPPFMDAVRRRDEVAGEHERVMKNEKPVIEKLGMEMEAVVARADMLRTHVGMKIVEILNPHQNIKFLTAVAQLQLKIRNMGFEKQ